MVGEVVSHRESAIAIKVRLPPDLERFRVTNVGNAALGVPAHITLIYPFAPADRLDARVRVAVAAALSGHPTFEFALSAAQRWPGVLYLPVTPVEPFEAIVRSLVAAFPDHLPSAGEFPYIPHVTIAEGEHRVLARLRAPSKPAPAESQLVTRVLLIAQDQAGRWRVRWRFGLRLARPTPPGPR